MAFDNGVRWQPRSQRSPLDPKFQTVLSGRRVALGRNGWSRADRIPAICLECECMAGRFRMLRGTDSLRAALRALWRNRSRKRSLAPTRRSNWIRNSPMIARRVNRV